MPFARGAWAAAVVALAALPARAFLNGGFESGFASWTTSANGGATALAQALIVTDTSYPSIFLPCTGASVPQVYAPQNSADLQSGAGDPAAADFARVEQSVTGPAGGSRIVFRVAAVWEVGTGATGTLPTLGWAVLVNGTPTATVQWDYLSPTLPGAVATGVPNPCLRGYDTRYMGWTTVTNCLDASTAGQTITLQIEARNSTGDGGDRAARVWVDAVLITTPVCDSPTPTRSATATPSPTSSATPTVTASPAPSGTDSPTISGTATESPTTTESGTPTESRTASPTSTRSSTRTSSGTFSATSTPTSTSTPTRTRTQTRTPTPTFSPTDSPTRTTSPTATTTGTPLLGSAPIAVAPNPVPYAAASKGQVWILLVARGPASVRCYVHDTAGKLLTERAARVAAGENRIPFDLRDAPPGVYYLWAKITEDAGPVSTTGIGKFVMLP